MGERIAGLAGRGVPCDFQRGGGRKLPLLYEAAGNFLDRGPREPKLADQWEQFQEFCRVEAVWLDDYALYAVLRRQPSTPARGRSGPSRCAAASRRRWPRQPSNTAARLPRNRRCSLPFRCSGINFAKAAAEKGIRILGDVAIFVNMDSADVWVHPEIFELDEELKPVRVAGVPPDYFSPTGQRWGNPLYRWDVLAERGFDWWIDRIRHACKLYDIVRLDHFRGFEAYWAIPAAEQTAVNGEWVKAPGLKLFRALEAALGPLPLVAEDLGLITPEVDALRLELGMPGMKVVQFGFGDKGAHIHLPHRYTVDTVAYTGTHDNDTTQGWWSTLGAPERAAVQTYVGDLDDRPTWPLMRATAASVAEIAIAPAQDLLELGSEARMNTPAVATGNWSWRAPQGSWTTELAAKLASLVAVTDRENDPLSQEPSSAS
jgi:4-alpha-glucanotransferase